jgi:hypothetical protein
MLPLPAIQLPNSRHLHALSLLPTLPLGVLGAGCCTYGQDGCTTCLRHSLQCSVCAISFNMRKHFLLCFLLMFALVSEALHEPACQMFESRLDGLWLMWSLFTRGVCALRQRFFQSALQSRGMIDKESS